MFHNEEEVAAFVSCDWCGRHGVALQYEGEIVVVRLKDGSLEPELWCPECQMEAARYSHDMF